MARIAKYLNTQNISEEQASTDHQKCGLDGSQCPKDGMQFPLNY
jgi:hypothetical protein